MTLEGVLYPDVVADLGLVLDDDLLEVLVVLGVNALDWQKVLAAPGEWNWEIRGKERRSTYQ